jgi:TatD DNase family protein
VNLSDTHCHLDLEKFDLDRELVLDRAWQTGLSRILIPGIDLASSRRIVELAKTHSGLFAAMGVHPSDSLTWDANTWAQLKQLFMVAQGNTLGQHAPGKIVAIGEIGLDYYWNDAPHEHQKMVLQQQLDLAAELKLPVILHMRETGDALDGECSADLIEILQVWVQNLRKVENPLAKSPGVLHSFSGSLGTANKALDLNFYIGITGPLTYKNADVKRAVVKSLPLERILLETDSPFLAPVPKRGLRNEPAFVRYVADKIAEIHNKNPDEIATLTTANATRLFSWGG